MKDLCFWYILIYFPYTFTYSHILLFSHTHTHTHILTNKMTKQRGGSDPIQSFPSAAAAEFTPFVSEVLGYSS